MRRACVALAAILLWASPAAAEAPALTMDDGYTFFEMKNKMETKKGKPVSKGWSLVAALRMIGPAPRRSAFELVMKKGRKKLGAFRCEGAIYTYSRTFNAFPTSFIATSCKDRKLFIKAHGDIKVEVYFVNGDDDSKKLMRTYTLVVRKVSRVRGSPKKPTKDADLYYISRHGDAACSIIYAKKSRMKPYVAAGKYSRARYWDQNTVEIVYSISTNEVGQGLSSGGFLRCKVDGKRIKLETDSVSNTRPSHRFYRVVHTHRKGAKYRKGPPYKEEINFRQYYVQLPLTFGPKGQRSFRKGYASLDDHPGKWECDWKMNGKTIRTWRWTVAAGGKIAAHPEEGPTLGLAPDAHLVETEIPKGGSFADARLVPAEAKKYGCFYGHKWTSKEGKAMAKKVPKKGKAKP